ncbi:hypothetical protein HKCCSP123_04555 [Rhodobacterales bacterium HKCCSP123]|nr:hypothetical protein [Rhodobacterales bacterium HKCCSP123]
MTGRDWLEVYFRALEEAGGQLVLSEVEPEALETLRSKGFTPEVLVAYLRQTVALAATEEALVFARNSTGAPMPVP